MDFKEAVQKAKEAVEGIEEPLRQIAFQRILDKLLDHGLANSKNVAKKSIRKKVPRKKTHTINKTDHNKYDTINRSEFPDIYLLKKTLPRALYILRIVQDKLSINELSATDIAHILTNTFRIKATKHAVSMALMEAKLLVDRSKMETYEGKQVFVYKLMEEGEKYLEKEILNEKHEPK